MVALKDTLSTSTPVRCTAGIVCASPLTITTKVDVKLLADFRITNGRALKLLTEDNGTDLIVVLKALVLVEILKLKFIRLTATLVFLAVIEDEAPNLIVTDTVVFISTLLELDVFA